MEALGWTMKICVSVIDTKCWQTYLTLEDTFRKPYNNYRAFCIVYEYANVYFPFFFFDIQSLEDETAQTVLFWDILWQENFVCMNCETYLSLECAPKPPWPPSFEKSKIHHPNPEKLQFKGSKIQAILLDLKGKC